MKCLVCKGVGVLKEYNIYCHYANQHEVQYSEHTEPMKDTLEEKESLLTMQQKLFSVPD